jgi:2-C-methyl-D-erythritol 2,4-cyclodiphosphate synthase
MKAAIAAVIKTEPGNVTVKATTTEKLGFTGREEGVVALAVVLLSKEIVTAPEL